MELKGRRSRDQLKRRRMAATGIRTRERKSSRETIRKSLPKRLKLPRERGKVTKRNNRNLQEKANKTLPHGATGRLAANLVSMTLAF